MAFFATFLILRMQNQDEKGQKIGLRVQKSD